MKHKVFVNIYFIFIILFSCKSLSNNIPDNKTAKKQFDNSYKKWQSMNINKYYMKLNFGAFSPLRGMIEITVENGKIIKFIHNNTDKTEEFKNNMPQITMADLFEKAKGSYQNKPNSIFVITVDYDKNTGYVKMISRTTNKKNAPTDKTYKYEVLEFKKLK
jgi:hypothetical protein